MGNDTPDKWVCLKMLCTPFYPMVLLIIIPMKNGYFIGKINPTFSDKPKWQLLMGMGEKCLGLFLACWWRFFLKISQEFGWVNFFKIQKTTNQIHVYGKLVAIYNSGGKPTSVGDCQYKSSNLRALQVWPTLKVTFLSTIFVHWWSDFSKLRENNINHNPGETWGT